MTKVYEFVVLFSPELNENQLQIAQDSILEIIKKNNGTVQSTDVWGKKILAYPINRLTEAFYVFHTIEMDTKDVQNFDKDIRLSDLTLRYLLVIQDEDTLKSSSQSPEITE